MLLLREAIKKSNLTIQEIADKMNVSRQSLANTIQKGNPTVETLERIAEAINIPIERFFLSPDKIIKDDKDNVLICPKCGAKLELRVKE